MANLRPLEKENKAILGILEIGKKNAIVVGENEKHLVVGFSFNPEFDGYALSVISYHYALPAPVPFPPGYVHPIMTHPKFTELLAVAEELGRVTELKAGRLVIHDDDVKHINMFQHLRKLQLLDCRFDTRNLSKLRLAETITELDLVRCDLKLIPMFDRSNSVTNL